MRGERCPRWGGCSGQWEQYLLGTERGGRLDRWWPGGGPRARAGAGIVLLAGTLVVVELLQEEDVFWVGFVLHQDRHYGFLLRIGHPLFQGAFLSSFPILECRDIAGVL